MRYDFFEKLLEPVALEDICGASLDDSGELYDIENLMKGKPETQFSEAEPPDWKAVLELIKKSFAKSKDLWLCAHMAEAILHTDGVEGAARCVEFTRDLLDRYWQELHPHVDTDDEEEPFRQRLSPLETLFSSKGHVHQLLQTAPLTKAPRAKSFNHTELKPLAVKNDKQKLAEFHAVVGQTEPEFMETLRDAFTRFRDACAAIAALVEEKTGASLLNPDAVISLCDDVLSFLDQADSANSTPPEQADAEPEPNDEDSLNSTSDESTRDAPSSGNGRIRSKADVKRLLDAIIQWYEENDSASPIPFLLRRAGQLVDKNFIQIMTDLSRNSIDDLRALFGEANRAYFEQDDGGGSPSEPPPEDGGGNQGTSEYQRFDK